MFLSPRNYFSFIYLFIHVYKYDNNINFSCRKTQEVLDKCVLDHIGVERPAYGHFAEVKVHDSKRPKPVEKIVEYPTVPTLPDDAPKPPARFGGRWLWES